MKACVLEENNKVTYKEIETPVLKDGEVLIKIKACGICNSDFARVFNNGAYFYPLVLGHEFSGEIVDCAKDVDKKYIGKNAVVFPLLPCNECEFCKEKMYAQCKNYSYFGSRQNGAMAEYIAVPLWNVKPIPDDMDCNIAALCEPTAVAVNAVSKIENYEGKKVCIIGSGTIGIECGLMAKLQNAEVSFVVRNEEKKEFLKGFGFNSFVSEDETTANFDVVFECVGTNASINNALLLVKSKGTVVYVGNPKSDIEFPQKTYWKILRSELNIKGVWNSHYKNSDNDDWDKALEFLYRNSIIVKRLITDTFVLGDGIKAFEQMQDKTIVRIKGMFKDDKCKK